MEGAARSTTAPSSSSSPSSGAAGESRSSNLQLATVAAAASVATAGAILCGAMAAPALRRYREQRQAVDEVRSWWRVEGVVEDKGRMKELNGSMGLLLVQREGQSMAEPSSMAESASTPFPLNSSLWASLPTFLTSSRDRGRSKVSCERDGMEIHAAELSKPRRAETRFRKEEKRDNSSNEKGDERRKTKRKTSGADDANSSFLSSPQKKRPQNHSGPRSRASLSSACTPSRPRSWTR